ncbi:hypothetical protein TGAM01_v200881 [Trichoderma gamsii]|uniref:Uncharacterized protein n=1 Tax=Trichoderma gamsii TaxID=398673 RepID=A0A2P5A1P8_9HYPO|nr:hypothetical protein TGAM01_v200881 [Trichoderma gamsii]PON30441.1 hypothetical protein TGAM01_v200881 [Trichoderma gamsii]
MALKHVFRYSWPGPEPPETNAELAAAMWETPGWLLNHQLADLANRKAARIATPYVEGASLQLEITENHQDLPLPRVTSASIIKILDVTMSSVMRVLLRLDSGETLEAVLKLFDRRFGEYLRSNGRVHWPYMRRSEDAFDSFVRRNVMDRFITKLLREREKALFKKPPCHFISDDDDDGEEKDDDIAGEYGMDRFEAALWQECEDMFDYRMTTIQMAGDH